MEQPQNGYMFPSDMTNWSNGVEWSHGWLDIIDGQIIISRRIIYYLPYYDSIIFYSMTYGYGVTFLLTYDSCGETTVLQFCCFVAGTGMKAHVIIMIHVAYYMNFRNIDIQFISSYIFRYQLKFILRIIIQERMWYTFLERRWPTIL